MLNNHIAEFHTVGYECLECGGSGQLDFENVEELLDYCDSYQSRDTTDSMVKQFERNGVVDCPECSGKGHIERFV